MRKVCFIFVVCFFAISVNAAVRIGTPIYNPPYINLYDPVNGVSGFDIDLMKKICDRLNWQCEFIPMQYRKLFSALQENKIDFAIGGIVIMPKLHPDLLFSIPYLPSSAGFLLRKDSPFKTLKDLEDKKVGVVNSLVYQPFLEKKFSPKMSIIPYKLPRILALDLYHGKIDAVCMNYLTVLFIKHQYPNDMKALKEHFSIGEGLGLVTIPANKDKMDQINKVILQFESDGTFVQLYNYTFQFIISQPSK